MICTSLQALIRGAAFAGAMVFATQSVEAKGPALSYQMLVAVDDPAASSTPAAPTQPVDNETPLGLQPDAEKAAAAEAEEVKAKDKPVVEEEEGSVFKTWWFWALTAGIVGSTVALGVWAAQPGETPARICQPGSIACFGDGRN